jgi:hypothetical protein
MSLIRATLDLMTVLRSTLTGGWGFCGEWRYEPAALASSGQTSVVADGTLGELVRLSAEPSTLRTRVAA